MGMNCLGLPEVVIFCVVRTGIEMEVVLRRLQGGDQKRRTEQKCTGQTHCKILTETTRPGNHSRGGCFPATPQPAKIGFRICPAEPHRGCIP